MPALMSYVVLNFKLQEFEKELPTSRWCDGAAESGTMRWGPYSVGLVLSLSEFINDHGY
jgi:hypothetical protein